MAQSSSGSPASQPGAQPAAPKPQRSPAERLLVWGGILVLLLLVGMQARARMGYSKTLEALQDRMAEDEGSDANPLKVADLNDYVFGWPSRKEESKGKHLSTIELTWTGLPMTKPLGLIVGYDPEEDGGTVMALETSGYVEPEPSVAPPPFSKDEAARMDKGNIPPGAPGGPPAGDEPEPAGDAAGEPAPATDPAPTTDPAPVAEPAPATEPAATDPAATEQPAESPAADPAPADQPAAETPVDK